MKRLPDELEILEHKLPGKSVKKHKIGRAISEVTDDVFSEQKIKWQRSLKLRVCVFADGVVAMAAGLSGLVLWAKKTTYCNHREVLASKNLNPILPETFTGVIKVIYVNQKSTIECQAVSPPLYRIEF
jgi:hypothetical protein